MREGKRSKNIVTSFSYPIDKIDIIEQAEEAAKEKGMSLSQYIVSTFEELLKERKNAVGLENNPISITYGCQAKMNPKSNNTLDYYLEKGLVTRDHFREELKGKPIEHLQKVSALCRTINMVAELEIGFAKTGKYTIH